MARVHEGTQLKKQMKLMSTLIGILSMFKVDEIYDKESTRVHSWELVVKQEWDYRFTPVQLHELGSMNSDFLITE